LIGFPLGYILAEYFDLQVVGYWIGFIAGLTTAALLLSYRLITMLKRLNPTNN
jgi:Na+-driven multidrug efflux pump